MTDAPTGGISNSVVSVPGTAKHSAGRRGKNRVKTQRKGGICSPECYCEISDHPCIEYCCKRLCVGCGFITCGGMGLNPYPEIKRRFRRKISP